MMEISFKLIGRGRKRMILIHHEEHLAWLWLLFRAQRAREVDESYVAIFLYLFAQGIFLHYPRLRRHKTVRIANVFSPIKITSSAKLAIVGSLEM